MGAVLKRMQELLTGIPDKAWGFILFAGSLILLFWKNKNLQDAKSQLETAESKKTDAVLAEKQSQVHEKEAQVLEEAVAEKAKKLSPEELAKETSRL